MEAGFRIFPLLFYNFATTIPKVMKKLYPTTCYALRALLVVALTFALAACGDDDNTIEDPTPVVGETPPEAVDLGLPSGTKWAASNLNFTGKFVAWGALTSRSASYCTWESYRFGTPDALTKYCFMADYGKDGYTDEAVLGRKLTELEPEDDIARQIWGEGWRIPSKKQWEELISNCEITKQARYIILRSRRNNNSIQLPKQGYAYGSNYDTGLCCYWSRTLHETLDNKAYCFLYNKKGFISDRDRAQGMSIRPVKEN